jgi:predicted AAA+ superfamily ATPase
VYNRILSLNSILERKSVFLFGPRQTGKSTYLRKTFPEALYLNLLSKSVYESYLNRTDALASDITLFHRKNSSNLVIIDEIQKIPGLLDEVHHQIEANKNLRFILTGSSARKLRREGVNLLGGRASWRYFFPLVYPEIGAQLSVLKDLEHRLLVGGLPYVFDSKEPFEDLDDYIQLYLQEEIKAEGLVRNHEGFHRFLLVAALVNTGQVNFTQIGNDAQIPPRTVHDYFQILEDTLIGYLLPAFTGTISRKAMSSAKFYLFDTGVTNALLGRTTLALGTKEFGDIFEQFVILEVKSYFSYLGRREKLSYWRSTSNFEVDLIIEDAAGKPVTAIEIKSRSKSNARDSKSLKAFAEDFPGVRKMMVTLEERHYLDPSGIEIVPIFDFLKMLWNGEI